MAWLAILEDACFVGSNVHLIRRQWRIYMECLNDNELKQCIYIYIFIPHFFYN